MASVVRGSKVRQLVFRDRPTGSRRVKKSRSPLSFSSEFTENLNIFTHKDWLAPAESVKIISDLKDPSSVVSVFHRLSTRKDYNPSEALYASVINKLAEARKFDEMEDLLERIKQQNNCRLSEDFFYNAIKIFGYIAGRINRAIQTLFEMPRYGYWPSVKTFNLVLNLLVITKQFDIIHEVYVGGAQLGIETDACTLNIIMKGLCECGNVEAAFNLLDEFPKQRCTPNVRTYSTLIHGLCKHGRVNEARELLEVMEQEGVPSDAITFNILISGLRKEGRTEEAVNLLTKMQYKGCKPNGASYQEVLYALLDAERFVEAKNLMVQMISRGKCPSFVSYKRVIYGLCERKLLGDVSWALKHMVDHGFAPKLRMWEAVIDTMVEWESGIDLEHVIRS